MATDIAFSLGVLGMVKGIPSDLKIFLLSLAIADDIGAILVIAVFYSGSIDRGALFAGLFILGLIFFFLKVGISQPVLYFVLGVGFWVAILRSGIHATIAGVILGFMVPTTAALSLQEFQDIATDMSRGFRDAMGRGDVQGAKNLLGSFDALAEQYRVGLGTPDPPVERLGFVSGPAAVCIGQCRSDVFPEGPGAIC